MLRALFHQCSHGKKWWQNSCYKGNALKEVNFCSRQKVWKHKALCDESNRDVESIYRRITFPHHHLDLWMASSVLPGKDIEYEVFRSALTKVTWTRSRTLAEPLISIQESVEWGIKDLQVIRQDNEQKWDKSKQNEGIRRRQPTVGQSCGRLNRKTTSWPVRMPGKDQPPF